MSMGMTKAAPATTQQQPAWRILAMMTAMGGMAGALIVWVYQVTLPPIEQHKGEVVRAAVQEVLKGPASFDTLYEYKGALVKTLPAGTSTKDLEKIYLGHDRDGNRMGFAITHTENGFQDPVTVTFGYDAAAHTLFAMRVISNKETPGLGDKIVKDSAFVDGFVNAATPINGVKKDRGKSGPNDVVMITGATISSRAVIRIINDAIVKWQPLMDAYHEESKP